MGTVFDIKDRTDRIGRYFRKYLDRFIFAELSETFMERSGAYGQMKGVPVPLRKDEVRGAVGGDGIDMSVIAENMIWVMGCDPHFKHTGDYAAILKAVYGDDVYVTMAEEGREAAKMGEMDSACIHFRASLCVGSDYLHGIYGYARACRAMYLAEENEEYVGRFKAEALEWFEILTVEHPDFAPGYYYLGYGYLNMGLYKKAEITWKSFLRYAGDGNEKEREEIEQRLEQMKDPLVIEAGCNDVIAGRYESGIDLLEPFLSSGFAKWWPLHYYLGVAYEMTARRDDAIREFKETLKLNGSHLETMEELLSIYEDEGDDDNADKYSRKIELVKLTMDEDRRASLEETKREDEELMSREPEKIDPEMID